MKEIMDALREAYLAHDAADAVILGFIVEGTVFYAEVTAEELIDVYCGKSKTSDEEPVFRWRVKALTKKTEAAFFAKNPVVLCDEAMLLDIADKFYEGNRGYAFEKLVCNAYNGTLSSQNLPFWEGGDFTANGKSYSCKFQFATVIHERHLAEIAR
jgi:hypothetical protein